MSAEKLFTPLKVGAVTAPNRVFMAPLTVCAALSRVTSQPR